MRQVLNEWQRSVHRSDPEKDVELWAYVCGLHVPLHKLQNAQLFQMDDVPDSARKNVTLTVCHSYL